MEDIPKSGHISMGGRIGGTGGTCPHKIYELLRNLVFNNRNVSCEIIVPPHVLISSATTGYIPLVLVIYKLIMYIPLRMCHN